MLLREIAEEYGASLSALQGAATRGTLPSVKVNGRRHVSRSAYEEWRKKIKNKKKINTGQCMKCKYSMRLNTNDWCCDYLGITGHMRECNTYPTCEKFEKRRKGK